MQTNLTRCAAAALSSAAYALEDQMKAARAEASAADPQHGAVYKARFDAAFVERGPAIRAALAAFREAGGDEGHAAFIEADLNRAQVLPRTPDSPLWQQVHPDFPAAELPDLTVGWADVTDDNSTSPAFENHALAYGVIIERTDPGVRHIEGSARFSLCPIHLERDDDSSWVWVAEDERSFETWAGVQAFLIGERFAARLAAALGAEVMVQIRDRNGDEVDSPVCATHDFCDANVVMDEAFTDVLGRSVWLGSDVDAGRASEAEEVADLALWDLAWRSAKRRHLCEIAPVLDQ